MNSNSKLSRAYTVLFLENQNQEILLGMKKRGFGVGKWDGFGGKVKENESVNQACIREMQEESGITPLQIKFIGFLTILMDNEQQVFQVHGDIKESEEMLPKWFKIVDIPYKTMWPDEEFWYPLMLQNKFFYSYFHYKDNDIILEKSVNILNNYQELLEHQKKYSPSQLE